MQYAYFNWKRGSKISLRDKVRIIGVNYLYFQTPNSERLGVEFVSAGTPGGNFPTMLMFVIKASALITNTTNQEYKHCL